jgi:hypothetical protein
MKIIKFLLEIFFVITVVSCNCNISENKKMLNLMLTQPDSIWINIQNNNIAVDSNLKTVFPRHLNDVRDYIKNYLLNYEIIDEDCDEIKGSNTISNFIIIKSQIDTNKKVIFKFVKEGNDKWKFNGITTDPLILYLRGIN